MEGICLIVTYIILTFLTEFLQYKMPKNPIVNRKSREQRKTQGPVARPQEHLFCPPTMVRYDETTTGYDTIWACKMCIQFLLSEEAVRTHILICNKSTNNT